jgi:hypothetical protein
MNFIIELNISKTINGSYFSPLIPCNKFYSLQFYGDISPGTATVKLYWYNHLGLVIYTETHSFTTTTYFITQIKGLGFILEIITSSPSSVRTQVFLK